MTKKKEKHNRSTLFKQEKCIQNKPILPLPYNSFTEVLKRSLTNVEVVFQSNRSLASLLGNTKDKLYPHQQKGIYKIACSNCEATYIGQTRRAIKTRIREHWSECSSRYNNIHIYKSAVAEHMAQNNHSFSMENDVEILYTTSNERVLDAVETLMIRKNSHQLIMNRDMGPVISKLYDLVE